MLAKRASLGLPTPSWDRRPVLFDDLEPVWETFWDLSAARDFGFSANPIRASDISAHLQLRAVSREEWCEWYSLIRALDVAYLDEVRKRRDEERERDRKRKGARNGNAQGRDRRA